MANNNHKYDKYTREELVDELETLKKKKYGLVWDKKNSQEMLDAFVNWENVPENFVPKQFPVLKEVKNKEIENDKVEPANLIIEGDNYHSLAVLNFTHQNKIDVIYIDPPYNTGNKSWKYNNDYVEKDDAFLHSKWLSFMYKRLLLAKNLLKKTGVLVCAIDDNEHAPLGLLLQEIFPDYEIVSITIIHNPAGIQGQNFSYTHEYAYFVFPKGARYIDYQTRNSIDSDIRNFRDVTGDDSLRNAAKNCFYPILIKDQKIIGFGDVCSDNFHPKRPNIKRKNGIIEIYPIDPQGVERKWRFARQTVDEIKNELKVHYLKSRNVFDIKRIKNKFNYKTVWTDSKYSANNHGTQLLNKIIDVKFPYPKSLYTVEDCIKAIIHDKNNAIILDFFAGSGTTGHAVLELNKRDDGKRRFILATNNEGNICTEICYPRIEKIINGYKNTDGESITGLGGNLKYFKTDFVGSDSTDKNKRDLVSKSAEMICIKEDIFDLVVDKGFDYKIYQKGKKFLGVIFEIDAIADFKKEAEKYKGNFVVYCFSYTEVTPEKEFKGLKNKYALKPIPAVILRIYLEIFKK